MNMAKNKEQSVEPSIANMVNGWLSSYECNFKSEHESINSEIDNALSDYYSKQGGKGGNRPDAKMVVDDKYGNHYPILIEYKGYKNRLIKLDADGRIENTMKNNTPHYGNIKAYAVNGAIHYSNAILHYTSYEHVIAIGVTGYRDATGKLIHEIGVYYVSKENYGTGQKVGEYHDLSFLRRDNFDDFIEKAKALSLTREEADRIKEKREKEIDISLKKLNNSIFSNETGLGENDRVYLVASSIMATLGIPGKVKPLSKDDLKSSAEEGERDGDIIARKISAFLKEKHLPDEKQEMIVRTLKNTLLNNSINNPINGESKLKRIFIEIVDDLGIYYKIGLTTDFTGKLFNEMYSWLGFTQDKLNDVVLTPSYVAKLLAKLARVNKNSYVWDFATGSSGLLVAAMNEMITDAKETGTSPDQIDAKIREIKNTQLLGIEVLPGIYMLAILNMILMGDGCSNIINEDSLSEFDGKYPFGENRKAFPATAFVLNPPYSAEGKGMVFVQKALDMMKKGYAAVLIQGSAGSGKATDYNKEILKKNTLLASIKMPKDLFAGKSSVQTYIYVFRVAEAHQKDDLVRFIDFSNDGYIRSARKKSSNNLVNSDRAEERYDEIVNLVRFGKSKLNIFTEKEFHEGTIDPENGNDWNQSAAQELRPQSTDIQNAVYNYFVWEVAKAARESKNVDMNDLFHDITWSPYKIGDLFELCSSKKRFDANKVNVLEHGIYPYIVRIGSNNGQKGYLMEDEKFLNEGNTISFGQDTATMYYQEKPYFTGDKIKILKPKFNGLNKYNALFIISAMEHSFSTFSWGDANFDVVTLGLQVVQLPSENGHLNLKIMEEIVRFVQDHILANVSTHFTPTVS